MPSESIAPEPPARLTSLIEPIAKGTAVVVAACYAMGFLIKNFYLALWSTFSAKFVEVEYVLSGALFVVVVLLSIGFARLGHWMVKRARVVQNSQPYARGARLRAYARTLVVLAAETGVIAAILGTIYRESLGSRDYLLAILTFAGLPLIAVFTWKDIVQIWKDYVQGRPAMYFAAAATLLGGMLIHACFIYPYISPVCGGGKHRTVKLRTTDAGAQILQDVGFRSEPPHSHLFAVDLIAEDENYLTLAAPNAYRISRSAVRMRRDEVSSIVTVPN